MMAMPTHSPMTADARPDDDRLGTRLTRAVAAAGDTQVLRFGPGVVAQTGLVFAGQFPGAPALVVADENTFDAAGTEVVASLQAAGVRLAGEPHVFPGRPTLKSSYTNVTRVRDLLATVPEAVCCVIASGTLNDVVKLAAGELGRPYLVVCTAASVDGYTAFGASIERDGFKITRACPAPVALVADTEVMAAAPRRLTATGYGDLIEKLPAGADWILADELGVEPIAPEVWDLVQPAARTALADPQGVSVADMGAVTGLAEANLLSGLAMQAVRSSRPASGAGHLFSHVWEMEGHGQDWEPPLSHGFKVGIGTIASCALWEQALAFDPAAVDVDRLVATAPGPAEVEDRCRSLLAPPIAEAAVEQSLAKLVGGEALRERLVTIQRRWPQIRRRCAAQLIPPDEVARRLDAAGAPCHPSQIGIDLARLRRTYFQAQLIRSRYTVLDLLAELGVLTDLVDRLFGPDGFWSRQPLPAAGEGAR